MEEWLRKLKETAAEQCDDLEDVVPKPEKSMRRAAKERIIKKALAENAVLDLDAIFEDGKLFGHTVFLSEIPSRINTGLIHYGYKGEIYVIEVRFDFMSYSIELRISQYCGKIKGFAQVVKQIPFCMFYRKSRDLTRMMFDDVATQMIQELKKRLEEYD